MIEKGNLIVDGYVDEVMRKARQQIMLYIRVNEGLDEAGQADRAARRHRRKSKTSKAMLHVTLEAGGR